MSAVEELNWKEIVYTSGNYRQIRNVVSAGQPDYLARIEVRTEGEMVSEHMFEASRVFVGR